MVNIIFRHYRKGDETQLADLFNLAFKKSMVKRDPSNWNWRYIKSPGFEPEMCKIAEDIKREKIIGAVYANPIEIVPIGRKEYIVGEINDVTTHPSYIKKGIALRLMENSIEYMKEKGCDFSILFTGLKGIARSRLYQKLGYKDVEKQYFFIHFPYLPHLINRIFGFALFLPVLLTISYIPRYLNRLRINFIDFFKDFSYEIQDNKYHFKYLEVANRINPKVYEGYPKYDKEKFMWLRVNVPKDNQRPTYIFVKKNGKVIGGSLITHEIVNVPKSKLKIRIGIIHEIFLDRETFSNSKNLLFGYIYLLDKVIKATIHRKLGVLFYASSFNNLILNQAFSKSCFFKILNSVVMVKELKDNLKFPKLKKPLYVPTYTSLGR